MSRLPADRLLHNFRVNAGLPPIARAFSEAGDQLAPTPGGRRNGDSELRGHFTGHFLSASAQL